jgi:hypothetical protein
LIRIKNVRPGILIIADAGLKLGPGESREVEELTPQGKQALANGQLVQIDGQQEAKPAGKTAEKAQEAKTQAKAGSRKSEAKESGKSDAAKSEAAGATTEESEGAAGGSGEQKDPAQKSLVEVESGVQ